VTARRRFTEAGEIYQFTQAELDAMGVTHDLSAAYLLRRGTTWQADCYLRRRTD